MTCLSRFVCELAIKTQNESMHAMVNNYTHMYKPKKCITYYYLKKFR